MSFILKWREYQVLCIHIHIIYVYVCIYIYTCIVLWCFAVRVSYASYVDQSLPRDMKTTLAVVEGTRAHIVNLANSRASRLNERLIDPAIESRYGLFAIADRSLVLDVIYL